LAVFSIVMLYLSQAVYRVRNPMHREQTIKKSGQT
jgi:hypothetical protein